MSRKDIVRFVGAAVAVLVGAWLVMHVLTLTERSSVSVLERAELRESYGDLSDTLAEEKAKRALLTEQVESLGETPIVPSTNDPLPQSIRYVPVPGRDGDDGEDGQDGEDSTTPGPAGPPSLIAGPQGEKGEKGDRGEKGESVKGDPGRGIADVACTGGLTPITFDITYDDGSTQTVTCGELDPVGPDPEPTE